MLLAMPGTATGSYPERKVAEPGFTTYLQRQGALMLDRLQPAPLKRYKQCSQRVEKLQAGFSRLSDSQLKLVAEDLRRNLRRHGLGSPHADKAMAIACEAVKRTTGLQPYPGQMMAARMMLDGCLAEMQTGEGKSFAITLTAICAALGGIFPHVITANDYLVERDAEATQKIAVRLGLTVGAALSGQEPAERSQAYRNDITFCTAREVVFDYLRDRLLPQHTGDSLRGRAKQLSHLSGEPAGKLLRGLSMAIIDEADSILLDEAVTPFVLSQPIENTVTADHYQLALEIATTLNAPDDYQIHQQLREIHVTDHGKNKVAAYCNKLPDLWQIERFREKLVQQALSALHLFELDRDYLIRDGEIHMIDAITGRLADGRKWSQGLHQLLELKESLDTTDELQQIGKMTYQRFFPRFLHLCGTSATLTEARGEFRHSYNLRVLDNPPRLHSQRAIGSPQLFTTQAEKWQSTLQQIQNIRAQQRATLAVVNSVADSQTLSQILQDANLPHTVLNARQDEEEAITIAAAGHPGQVTVATNMAGRGTDIKLTNAVVENGGLQVICCQQNSARRIDRQIQGRCARNGQPGGVEIILSLEDEMLSRYLPDSLKRLVSLFFSPKRALPALLARPLAALPQRLEEYRARQLRNALRRYDTQMRRLLSISGPGE